MNAPPRILESATAYPGIKMDLARAKTLPPDRFDIPRGLEALRMNLEGISPQTSPSETSGLKLLKPLSGGVTSVVMGLGVLGVVALGAFLYESLGQRGQAEPAFVERLGPEKARVVEASSPQVGSGKSTHAPVDALVRVELPVVQAAPEKVAQKNSKSRRRSASLSQTESASKSKDDPIRLETSQLLHIRRLLLSDPAAAYDLARQGHRQFSGGMMHQEREALAIMALGKLGRTVEVASHLKEFEIRYPMSSFLPKLTRLQGKLLQ